MAKVIIADGGGHSDGSMVKLAEQVNAPMPIVVITRPDNYQFNEEILSLKGKPYLIFDVVELGWDAPLKFTHFFGVNTGEFSHLFLGEQWKRLDDFIANNPPQKYFCREMLAKDQTDYYVPINYPCVQPVPEPVTKTEFEQRPLDAFYTWGYSHPERRRLAGDIWIQANPRNYTVCDNLYYLEKFIQFQKNDKRWLAANIPDYCRHPAEQIINLQSLSKISISMPGAGTCCFRHTESCINSTMLMKEDFMAWSFPWHHNINCLKFLNFGDEIETISFGLNNPNLYDVYRQGVENCKKYEINTYIEKYLLQTINES